MAVRLCQSEYRALSFWLNSTSAWPATVCLPASALGVKGGREPTKKEQEGRGNGRVTVANRQSVHPGWNVSPCPAGRLLFAFGSQDWRDATFLG